MAKVIPIATHKGGVGKTVSAMAISAGLARSGQRCLLIDVDPQGHSGLGLDIRVSPGEPAIEDIFRKHSISDVIRQTHIPDNKKIILCNLSKGALGEDVRDGMLLEKGFANGVKPTLTFPLRFEFVTADVTSYKVDVTNSIAIYLAAS